MAPDPERQPEPQPLSVDLIVIVALVILATAAISLEWPPYIRVPAATLLVLFLPGYALVSFLFTHRDGPDEVARIALSVAISLALIPLIALFIEWSPWKIERSTMLNGLTAVSLVGVTGAVVRRRQTDPADSYSPKLSFPDDWRPGGVSRSTKFVAIGFIVAFALFSFAGYGVVRTRIFGTPLTELAIYNSSGKAGFYPDRVSLDGSAEVQISIVNREGSTVTYRLVIGGDGVATSELPPITLHNGQTWTQNIEFGIDRVGANLPVRFDLYRADDGNQTIPYRSVMLYVDGIATPQP